MSHPASEEGLDIYIYIYILKWTDLQMSLNMALKGFYFVYVWLTCFRLHGPLQETNNVFVLIGVWFFLIQIYFKNFIFFKSIY